MNIKGRVIEVICMMFDLKEVEITMESELEELGMDSLDGVELIMELEEEFGIEIPDEDAEKVKTVGQIVTYIEKRLK